ncbi:cytochrome c [Roseococcus sp. SYP-B2431]|uniref:c-type cytochrome n=1 Tax=Roseococcus sp. SYP-B2431 TaxID=2496640 RepID=UPI0013F3DFBB|nr:c-type cytochrome [Roseococcus sp. SYP-B2431]
MLAAAVLAAAIPGAAPAQDAHRGAELARQTCLMCHGENGRSQTEDIPSLAGQPADFITLQMILFREGTRQVPVMNEFAAHMPDKDIEDLAAFFASLPPGPPDDRRARDAALYAAGQALVGPRNCGVCHVSDFGGRAQIPRIAAQREEFLARSMMEYRDGRRAGADTQMNGAVVGLSDADIAALAHFLAQQD